MIVWYDVARCTILGFGFLLCSGRPAYIQFTVNAALSAVGRGAACRFMPSAAALSV